MYIETLQCQYGRKGGSRQKDSVIDKSLRYQCFLLFSEQHTHTRATLAKVVLFTLAGHAFRAEETCAGDRVTEVVFPEPNFVARVKTESPVDEQMRFADTSDNRADPREVGLFVNLRVSGVPAWRVSARDVGD